MRNGWFLSILISNFGCRNHKEWTLVSSSVKAGGNFVVLDLNPATWYNLKVTAHNNAGFSVAEYEFATLTVRGGMCTTYKICSCWLPKKFANDSMRILK